ncbi:MAG: type II toxin-antitoxin system PemK/MazF family toxin [bacterium]
MSRIEGVRYRQGDIVLVRFPFTDLSSTKSRPALVLSKSNIDDDVIAAAITSRGHERHFRFTEGDLQRGRLPGTSYVRCDKVATLHRSLVVKNVSALRPEKIEHVIRIFKDQF